MSFLPQKPTRPSSLEEILEWRQALRVEGKKLVLTNGCFDLLHAGHVRYLREARGCGDVLLVALNSDESVTRLKGLGRPIHSAEDRAEVLLGLEAVDRVVVFTEKRVTGLIEQVEPDIYVKGGDYTVETLDSGERAALEKVGAKIEILSLVAGRSTTSTLEKAQYRRPLRVGVLGSGQGSNLEAIFSAIEEGQLAAEVVIVLSDHSEAPILERARGRGVAARSIEFSSQAEIAGELSLMGVDLVVLAGYMCLVKEPLLSLYRGRMINIHPSLLPQYRGLEAWKQALEAGESETGCTVHYVDAGIDTGEVIAQSRVPILPGDTPEKLHSRIQEAEHALLPAVINQLAQSHFRDQKT